MPDYMKFNIDVKENTPEWYARLALRELDIPQRNAARKCLGAIFGALGAAIDGKDDEVEKLIADGQTYLSSWAQIAREHVKRSSQNQDFENLNHKTVQNTAPIPITNTEPNLDSDHIDLAMDDEDL